MQHLRKRWKALAPVFLAACVVGAAAWATGASATASKTTSAKSTFLLGVVSITTTDYGNHETILGIQAAAKKRGWKVDVIDANGSADAANSAIQNLVSRHAGAIFDLVFPTTSLKAGLNAAKAAHIPVATWGGGLGPGVVVTDGGGGVFAKPIVQYMARQMKGKGAVLALTYHVGLVCRNREQVFDSVLRKYPGIKVTKNEIQIPGYQTQAPQYATAWLAAHPKGSQPLAIWGCWEDPTIAALSALRQQGRTDVLTYGENGGPTAMSDILHGTLTATMWENQYKEGMVLVDQVAAALKAGKAWKPKTIDVPGELVTKGNIHAFLKRHPGLFPGLK
jgi:ribose transport system substrate-binding protein